MPKIKIHNRSSVNLNLSLSHLVPIHFQNNIKPQETWEVEVGSVWFTFECRPDRMKNRFSAMKSAQTIGLITLTGASIGLVAIPLTVLGLAPVVGPSTVLAHLATHSFITSAATPQVLGLTTWLATTFAKKTVYLLATERGVREDELEETVKVSNMIIDSIKYASLSKSLVDFTKLGGVMKKEERVGLKSKEIGVMGIMCGTGDLLEVGSKWLKDKVRDDMEDGIGMYRMIEERNEVIKFHEEDQSGSEESWTVVEKIESERDSSDVDLFSYAIVKGVYIGFGDDYEFEWREKVEQDPKGMGNVHGFELWDLKLGSIVR